ncbi:prolipoprotein diacylglyceryl transferase [Bacillaceae bacterium S4-13-58]
MKPLISFGPFTLYFFGLMIAVGAIVGTAFFLRQAKKRGLNDKSLLDIALYSLIGGIIGARIIFVLVYNPAYYLSDPIKIFFVHQGGLSIHGGLIGGLLVGYILLKKHKIPVWETLDIVAPALILAQGISRIGCDVFGGPISDAIPWGMNIRGEYLHPAQAYEFILDYILFGYLWLRLKANKKYHGQLFLHYFIGYMIIRGIVEFSRVNPTILGGISVSHIMSLLGIVAASIVVYFRKKQGVITKNQQHLTQKDLITTIVLVTGLILASLIIYYIVQG